MAGDDLRGSRGSVSASSPLEVLVVDDDDETRDALVSAVRRMGHTCRGARDGLDAWEKHRSEHADVILSDWQMPGMDGLELCRRTRVSENEGAYTYFLFMTAFEDKEHFIRGLEAGADDYQTKPIDLDELRARLGSARRVVSLYRRLAVQNAALRRDSQASFRIARIDPLTQVANRLSMDEDLKVLWSRVGRYGHGYSLAICDIDRFKAHNDQFGHLAGDEVLRRVAQAIRDSLREGDGLYRYGGEEFLAVLPEQSVSDAAIVMDRVRLAVARLAIPTARVGHVVTISAGVAELDRTLDGSVDDWIQRADEALYRAKAAGRNRIETSGTLAG
jgi:two-component system chemotaxis response regulator CheY